MNVSGTIILSIVSLLERLSYYGSRAILVLFALDSEGLNLEQDQYFEYYATFSALIIIVPILTGLIVVKHLGQKRAVYLGGIISLIGYCLLTTQHSIITIASVFFILIGTSLVKPSTTILIGRQFLKEDRNRTLAYILFFFGINLGALIGIAGIGYIGEVYSWTYGFVIAAASTLLYVLIFKFTEDKIKEIETNNIPISNFRLNLNFTLLLIPFLVLLNVVYRQSYDTEHIDLIVHLSDSADRKIFNFEIMNSLLSGITSFWFIPLTIGLFVYWKLVGVSEFLKSVVISLIVLIVAILGSQLIKNIESNQILEYSLLVFALYAIVEVLMSSFIVSYLTRIIDTSYSNTIYSCYYLLVYMVRVGFSYIIITEYQTEQIVTILILSLLLLIGFRKQIGKLTKGIN